LAADGVIVPVNGPSGVTVNVAGEPATAVFGPVRVYVVAPETAAVTVTVRPAGSARPPLLVAEIVALPASVAVNVKDCDDEELAKVNEVGASVPAAPAETRLIVPVNAPPGVTVQVIGLPTVAVAGPVSV
jgi:hypothetical protein